MSGSSDTLPADECVNLKRRFGKRYRVSYEASYRAELGPHGRTEDPWLMIILCQHGYICPWGGDLLAACTDKSGPVAMRLWQLPFVDHNVSQRGGDGVNAVFALKHFDEVAAIMKPRRRRRLTDAQREAAKVRLAKYAFSPAAQRAGAGLESPRSHRDDPEHLRRPSEPNEMPKRRVADASSPPPHSTLRPKAR